VNGGVRFGWLPFEPAGPGPLYGSFEVGLEPLYQRYLDPHDAFFAGLGVTGRYHFLSLGRFVPYAEVAAFAGGTDLRIKEIDSDFTFLLWAGAGAAFFVTDRAALYAGYRWLHASNGNTKQPNRGFEAHSGVVGVSFFFE
jgi:lipid A 3-O-deacylase